MKKMILSTVLAGLTVMMVGCGLSNKENDASKTKSSTSSQSSSAQESKTSETTQIPNPFETVQSMEEAEKVAGFSMETPEGIEGFDTKIIQAIKSDMIQVTYQKAEANDSNVTIRKAESLKEDISGHYDKYEEESVQNQAGTDVKLRKNKDKYMVATWKTDTSSYSVDFKDGTDQETLLKIVNQVK